jgi:hypothetical protein
MTMPILDDVVSHLPDWAEGSSRQRALSLGAYDRSLADCDRGLALVRGFTRPTRQVSLGCKAAVRPTEPRNSLSGSLASRLWPRPTEGKLGLWHLSDECP